MIRLFREWNGVGTSSNSTPGEPEKQQQKPPSPALPKLVWTRNRWFWKPQNLTPSTTPTPRKISPVFRPPNPLAHNIYSGGRKEALASTPLSLTLSRGGPPGPFFTPSPYPLAQGWAQTKMMCVSPQLTGSTCPDPVGHCMTAVTPPTTTRPACCSGSTDKQNPHPEPAL